MPHIYITRQIPADGFRTLYDAGFKIEMRESHMPISRDELLSGLSGADIVITSLADIIDREFFEKNPTVKIVANYRPSFANFHILEANTRKVPLLYTPRVNLDAVPEFTIGLILTLSRKIHEGYEYVKSGNFTVFDPMLFQGMLLKGKTLGIVGFGNIGQRVADIADKAFGMRVLYTDPEGKKRHKTKAKYVDLDQLLAESDIVSIHLPPVPSSNNVIGHHELQCMKQGSLLINTSLSFAVQEGALLQNLRSGKLAGVAMDIHTTETPSTDNSTMHRELMQMPNVILTPQIASSTTDVRLWMGQMLAEDILALTTGKRPKNIVNPEVLR